ncbi:MAG: phosphoribosylglycinamide formyltransferase [bacterium]|nr:phosphoribosylglycinamide formyltransferase [bacterium]
MVDAVRAAVLLSGSGRTLENFLARMEAGELPLEIVAVVSSRSDVRGVDIARSADLPCGVFRRKDHPDTAAHNAALNAWLAPHRPELIVLAGYLCFYTPSEDFAGPVVNIHPALLPKYGGKGMYGHHVHEAVLAAGEKQSGCTVHLVNDRYDEGRILGQQKVPVLIGDQVDDLAARVFAAECELYPRVLARLAAELR